MTHMLQESPTSRRDQLQAGFQVSAICKQLPYFQNLLHELLAVHDDLGKQTKPTQSIKILNIASGSCHDIAEFFEANPHAPIHFTCVDMDANAITYAQNLCAAWLERITFSHQHVLRLQLNEQFDLVWNASLFDYFEDRMVAILLNKFLSFTKPSVGQLVVGNFADACASANNQEIGSDWTLNHRSANKLRNIAIRCGVAYDDIKVDSEEEGINLYLRIQKN